MSTASADQTKASVDPQDPLPESNWVPRRYFIFFGRVSQTLLIAAAGWAITKLGPGNPKEAIAALLAAIYCLTAMIITDAVLYLIAPSAEQFAKIVQTVSALKEGISFQTRTVTKATSPADGVASRAEATTTTTASAAAPKPQGSEEWPWGAS